MRKVLMCLMLSGCAGVFSEAPDVSYNGMNLKPTIMETLVDDGRLISISNPFPKTLTIVIDCDGELIKRKITIPGNSTSSFIIPITENNLACAIETGWVVR